MATPKNNRGSSLQQIDGHHFAQYMYDDFFKETLYIFI